MAEERGWTVQPEDTIFIVMAYVAETDEEAVREARPHIEKFFSWFHRVSPRFLSPPGYVSRDEFLRRARSAALAKSTEATLGRHGHIGRIACGSPETVAETIVSWARRRETAASARLDKGDMPEWKTVKNMTCSRRR